MRKFNETEKSVMRGIQSANWSWDQMEKVADLIKWYIGEGEKVLSASVDQEKLTIKFSNLHKYNIRKED